MTRPNKSSNLFIGKPWLWLVFFIPVILGCAYWFFAHERPTAAAVATTPRQPLTSADGSRLVLSKQDLRTLVMPNGDTRMISSLLNVSAPLHYGQFRWNDAGVPAGPIWVRVDLATQMMSVFRGEHEIGTGVILFGADSHPTPSGKFPVLAKYKDHESSLYEAKMPYTLRLRDDGVSIHGSNVREGAATHGCIGIPSAFAARLYDVISLRDPVYILEPDDITLNHRDCCLEASR